MRYRQIMKFHQIKALISVANAGSFSGAARTVRIAQPALSRSVAELEQTLGVDLLVRTNKGVTLTNTGKHFAKRAAALMAAFEDLAQETRHQAGLNRESVSMYVGTAIAPFFVPEIVREIEQSCDEIDLSVHDMPAKQTHIALEEGKVDLAYVPVGKRLEGVRAVFTIEEPLYFGGKPHPGIVTQGPISLSEALSHPLVLLPRSYFLRELIEAAAERSSLVVNSLREQKAGIILQSLIEDGFAFSILPWQAFEAGVAAGTLFARPVTGPSVNRTVALLVRSSATSRASVNTVAAASAELLSRLLNSGRMPGARLLENGPWS